MVSIVHNIKSTRLQRYDIIIKLCFRPVCATQVSCVPVSHNKNKPTNSGQCHPGYEGKRCERSELCFVIINSVYARARSSIPKKIWLSIRPIKNHVIIRAACLAGARLWKSAQQYGGNCGKTNNKHHFQKFTYFKSLSLFFVAHCG